MCSPTQRRWERGACAPEFGPARRDSSECLTYGAGLAAGAASAGLAAAAGLASADAEASGAAVVSSDLLQAAAKKNEIRTRIRTLRIAFLLETSALPVAHRQESANEGQNTVGENQLQARSRTIASDAD